MPSRTLRARTAPTHPSASTEALVTSSHGVAVVPPPVSGSRASHHAHAALATQVAERSYAPPRPEPRSEVRAESRVVLRPAPEAATVVGHLPRISPWQAAAKRALDVCGATVGLLLAAPLLALLVLAIRIDSGGGALFVQRRIGRNGRPFGCYKLRTMCVDAEARLNDDRSLREQYEANGYKLPVDCDPRVTRFGRFLRATSLDELPQLWNVLRGDMSLVGPRPLLMRYQPYYTARERVRFSVRPGVTGLAQVRGRNTVSWDERLALDVEYVERWSLALDLRLLLETVRVVSRGSGVVVDARAIMRNLDEERRDRAEFAP